MKCPRETATGCHERFQPFNSAPLWAQPHEVGAGLVFIQQVAAVRMKVLSTSTVSTKGDVKDQFHVLEVPRMAVLGRLKMAEARCKSGSASDRGPVVIRIN